MQREGLTTCVPLVDGPVERRPVIDFSSGYVKRAEGILPSQGDRDPWRVRQNHVADLAAMTFGRIDAGLEFGSKSRA